MINNYKSIVIKIGSSSIVNSSTKKIKSNWLIRLCEDIANLHKSKKIVIVCSGAIALGSKIIKNQKSLRRLENKQAAAAAGQIELAHQWKLKLKKYNIDAAQLLLTLDDSEIRRRYLNARKTIDALHKNNIIPIINENDTVATEEIRFGDNDRLAARVSQMINADLLILLSDIDGLYSSNPIKDKNAAKIKRVRKIDDYIEKMASSKSSNFGSGGMTTKIIAAKICMSNGCATIITSSNKKRPLLDIKFENSTIFYAKTSLQSSRKQWLLNHLHPSGSVVVDDGAHKAIIQNKSLLPAGIMELKGRFKRGDVITILNSKNAKIGIGVSAYDINDAKKIIGKKTRDISQILGYEGRDEMIHKDDLVKISQ